MKYWCVCLVFVRIDGPNVCHVGVCVCHVCVCVFRVCAFGAPVCHVGVWVLGLYAFMAQMSVMLMCVSCVCAQ